MKKLIALLLVVMLAVAMISTVVMAHTEDDLYATDLIADGGSEETAIDVGDVLVWNDADYLYVKYLITDEDWCLIETHLQVATSLDGIPQKNGNPPPGKFDFAMEHECFTEYTYTIPLNWDTGTELLIAAHAEIQTEEIGPEEEIIYVDETAWGAGEDFSGNNWAMYFMYTVQGSSAPGF
jgi:hypothetical protein